MLEVRVLPRQPCPDSFVSLVSFAIRTIPEGKYKPGIPYGTDASPKRLILYTAIACIKYQSFFRRAT